jgi:hypothetical protein
MVLTKHANRARISGFSRLFLLSCALVGGAVLTTGAPARAGLLNDMWSSDNSSDAGKTDGEPQQQRGLINRMFSSDDNSNAAKVDNVQKPQPASVATAPVAPPAAAPDEEKPGLFNRFFGGGSGGETEADRWAKTSPTPAPHQPGMLDKIGLGGPKETDKIDYSERPKLAVPQQRDLPPPRESAPRQVARPAQNELLTKPPADYLEKVRGADGKITGLKEGDIPKEKKFFGLF